MGPGKVTWGRSGEASEEMEVNFTFGFGEEKNKGREVKKISRPG